MGGMNRDVAVAGFVFMAQDWAELEEALRAELLAAEASPAGEVRALGSSPTIALPEVEKPISR